MREKSDRKSTEDEIRTIFDQAGWPPSLPLNAEFSRRKLSCVLSQCSTDLTLDHMSEWRSYIENNHRLERNTEQSLNSAPFVDLRLQKKKLNLLKSFIRDYYYRIVIFLAHVFCSQHYERIFCEIHPFTMCLSSAEKNTLKSLIHSTLQHFSIANHFICIFLNESNTWSYCNFFSIELG